MSRKKPTTGDAIVHALCSPCSPFLTNDEIHAPLNMADAVLAVAMELGRIADCMEADRKPKKGRKP